MALFSVTSIGATGLGPVAAGWVEMNPSLGWRWIQWISMMYVVLDSTADFLLTST